MASLPADRWEIVLLLFAVSHRPFAICLLPRRHDDQPLATVALRPAGDQCDPRIG
jgi:hypothetical protein